MTAALAAQPAPEAVDGPKQTISGKVVEAAAGAPVRGAKIVLRDGPQPLATTHSDFGGRFSVEAPAGRDVLVSVEKAGRLDRRGFLTVPAARPLTDVRIAVDRAGVIAGRVTDEHSQPVVGARVIAFEPHVYTEMDMIGRWSEHESTTDDRGEYRIWDLEPGEYVVAVMPEPAVPAGGVVRLRRAAAFYPAGLSLGEAEPVKLGWGQLREGVDLQTSKAAGTAVEISIAPRGGAAPCGNCGVRVRLDEETAPLVVTDGYVGEGTRLRVEGLSPGSYRASLHGVNPAIGQGIHGSARFTVTAGRTEEVALRIESPIPVRGVIELKGRPEPADGTTPQPWRGGVRLMPPLYELADGLIIQGLTGNLEIAGSESAFELSSYPGRVTLQVNGAGGAYLAEASRDGKPLDSPGIEIPNEGAVDGLKLQLQFAMGLLSGTLETPTGSENELRPLYMVYAKPAGDGANFGRIRLASARPDGGFELRLPPGEYEVIGAESSPNFGRLLRPAREAELRKFFKRVRIQPDETTQVELEVAPKL
ncbi:MAG: carboxypeptidase regulatory-like domain-containing protein [Acidobacteria bacterium]|nr:carboxypeptidase regulatory-like domain-containing protein [Acidobacteriota bacterium]